MENSQREDYHRQERLHHKGEHLLRNDAEDEQNGKDDFGSARGVQHVHVLQLLETCVRMLQPGKHYLEGCPKLLPGRIRLESKFQINCNPRRCRHEYEEEPDEDEPPLVAGHLWVFVNVKTPEHI